MSPGSRLRPRASAKRPLQLSDPLAVEGDRTASGGRILFAVGDIHGRSDLLDSLIPQLEAAAQGAPQPPIWVFLGDYVDRGPDTCGVLNRLIGLQGRTDIEVRILCGNHEAAMLKFLLYPAFGPTWMHWGGAATLMSYGLAAPLANAPEAAWFEARDRLQTLMPASHRALILDGLFSFEMGDYVFVHAGLRPGVPIADQDPNDLVMIRDEFLRAPPEAWEKVVVHGHTPAVQPMCVGRRIGVDTGAYATGILTAARIDGRRVSFLQAAHHRRDVVSPQAA